MVNFLPRRGSVVSTLLLPNGSSSGNDKGGYFLLIPGIDEHYSLEYARSTEKSFIFRQIYSITSYHTMFSPLKPIFVLFLFFFLIMHYSSYCYIPSYHKSIRFLSKIQLKMSFSRSSYSHLKGSNSHTSPEVSFMVQYR